MISSKRGVGIFIEHPHSLGASRWGTAADGDDPIGLDSAWRAAPSSRSPQRDLGSTPSNRRTSFQSPFRLFQKNFVQEETLHGNCRRPPRWPFCL